MNKKVCLIANGGGHLEELKQLDDVWKKYDCFYVVMKNKTTKTMRDKTYFIMENTKRNIILFYLKTLIISFQSMYILLKENPDIIISTGAGAAVPLCFLGKFLFKKKLIFIETFAKRNGPSKAGRAIYPIADLFIVQWEELLQFYPNAIYGGGIF